MTNPPSTNYKFDDLKFDFGDSTSNVGASKVSNLTPAFDASKVGDLKPAFTFSAPASVPGVAASAFDNNASKTEGGRSKRRKSKKSRGSKKTRKVRKSKKARKGRKGRKSRR